MKRIISIIILLAAIILAGSVIYADRTDRANEEALQYYLDNDGMERTEQPSEDEMIGFEHVEGVGVQPGMIAPDFTLTTLEGDEVSLRDYRGDFVIVNMWATWCPPCLEEMPHFVDFYEAYEDDNVEILGVNMTATERNIDGVQQFAEDFQLPFPIPLDEAGEMEDLYEIFAMPTTYIIDPEGRVAMNRPGYVSYDILEESYLTIRENVQAN
ncbi:TlpA family protein disulfide reductase [Paenalkalicoccus suaedae]|uniref:TlpA family protein disulfide reductase n=1 Tax=Paenalkalicoccus suaedae TaxID=2592382 RepID=A0A859FD65_9BACI|nr:TlpA disulfide reductase family protein [Paenalkalicoccus suaedae]QKS71017.1 TlpA family protein disulfide reductase [Paenalkalicoccus suaedae]